MNMVAQSRCLQPEGGEEEYVYVQQGIRFINCNGRKARQEVFARALGMATRPPDFICLIETNTWRWEKPATWLHYKRVAHNWQNLHSNRGVEIYKHDQCPYKVVTVAASADGDALLVQVYTHDTNYAILAVHMPHARKVGWKGYSMYWLALWANVRRHIDLRRVRVVGDVNSAFRLTDHKAQRPTDTVYLHACATLGLKHLCQLVDVPEGRWSCVAGQGTRIDTAALTERSSLRVTKAHYSPSTILSEHQYPLLLVVKVPAIRVNKPRAGCTPRMTESHMLPVHFTTDQKHNYAAAVYKRDRGDPVSHSRDFIAKLQLAM